MPVAAPLEEVLLNSCQSTDVTLPKQLALYRKDIDVKKLEIQLKMLPDLIQAYNSNQAEHALKLTQVTTLRTLAEVFNTMPSSKIMFSEVACLLQLVLTIPITTATAECTFSALRHLKTFLRTSMLQPCLNHCMLPFIHKDRTDQVDLTTIAKDFIAVNDRQRFYFGEF